LINIENITQEEKLGRKKEFCVGGNVIFF